MFALLGLSSERLRLRSQLILLLTDDMFRLLYHPTPGVCLFTFSLLIDVIHSSLVGRRKSVDGLASLRLTPTSPPTLSLRPPEP